MTDLFGISPSAPLMDHRAPSPTGDDRSEQLFERVPPPTQPVFPLCKQLRATETDRGEFFLHCISVYRELENHSSQIYLRNKLKKVDKRHKNYTEEQESKFTLQQLVPTHEWNQHDNRWDKLTGKGVVTEEDWCVKVEELEQFVLWTQKRTRKTHDEKLRLLKKFHIKEKVAQSLHVPIEIQVLDVLQQTLPFRMELQYRLGKYKLDAFIPRLRLAIQVDEHGHQGSNYSKAEEKEYDEAIRDANIVCLRFNPHAQCAADKPGLELVKQVWTRTLSPDFTAFRDKLQLV